MVKTEEILRFEENPEKIRKKDEIPKKKIIISHLRSKPSNLSRNMVKTVRIWRFEKYPQENLRNKKTKKKKRKENFKLRSFAHEVKIVAANKTTSMAGDKDDYCHFCHFGCCKIGMAKKDLKILFSPIDNLF